jgi:branched-chain amino acid transport system ATP-binding protein
LLRTISGLKEPKTGSIRMDERDLGHKRTEDIARLGIGHVPEGRGVIGEFTVEENLRLGAMMAKVNLHEGLDEQYARFPVLGDRRKQHAAKLSGGERQMLAMARALIAKPSVLLLDEPSLGLAPLVTAELMHTIHALCASNDLTVILVEQNASSALRIAHHAVVLHVGKVVANDTAANVAADENLRQYYLGLVE